MKLTVLGYKFTTLNEEETEISIYDTIADKKSHDWWSGDEGTEVTPTDFKEQLNNCKTKNITIRMNSCGGEVNAANVIAVAIQEARNAGKKIVCKIDGICASAAVQIAMVCDEVIIHQSALMMIHNPMVFLYGTYDVQNMEKVKNLLTATKDSIISYYTKKTGMTKQKISNMMDAETYMTGIEAVEKGFADSLMFDDTSEENVMTNIAQIRAINQALNIPNEYISKTTTNNISLEGGTTEMEIKNVEDLQREFPELTNELVQNAIANHTATNSANADSLVQAERERMKAIDELAGKVSNDLLTKAKYETFATAENVAMEAIKTGAFVQTQVLNALGAETEGANEVGAKETPAGAGEPDEKKAETEKASTVAENYLRKIGKVE